MKNDKLLKVQSAVILANARIQNQLILLDPGSEPALDSIQGRDDARNGFETFYEVIKNKLHFFLPTGQLANGYAQALAI